MKIKQSFSVVDQHGTRYTVQLFVDEMESTKLGGSPEKVEGLKLLRLTDGRRVDWMAKGKYQIVSLGPIFTSNDPGEILTSDDPNAP